MDRAHALAARLPATYAAFDVLAHPDHGGDALAARPYTERSWSTSAPRSSRSWQLPTGTPPCTGARRSSRRASKGSSLNPPAVRTRSAAGPCGVLTAPIGEAVQAAYLSSRSLTDC